MGEPTIYKPSIYNGAGIYNNGAGGGGGGSSTLPEGIEELESVKVINANPSINFGASIPYTDTTFTFIAKLGGMENTPGVLYNRNGSNIVGINNSGRIYVMSSYRNLYVSTNDYFTLTEKNGYINGTSVSSASDMTYILLFNKFGYQTFYPFVGRFKRFTVSRTAPNLKYCDVIPVIDKVNNAYGVYDLVSETLFTGGFAE